MHPSSSSRVRLCLTCFSIAANSLCAGGVFVVPVFSSVLASLLKLTQPQLTTIILVGIIGQYPFSPIVGKVIDSHGPSTCSLFSAAFFGISFLSSSLEISSTPVDITEPSTSSFHRLTLFSLLAGLGTVSSYFSSIFSASKSFPSYPGLAAGCTMALFGLSPLFLSALASNFFVGSASGHLDVARFLLFLASLTTTTHTLGAFALREPPTEQSTPVYMDTSLPQHLDENSQLIPKSQIESAAIKNGHPLNDRYFWLLAVYCLLTIGAAEMVVSNIGTIVLSLPHNSSFIGESTSKYDSATSTQVRILSISNTASRLLVGPLADFVSPVASYLPSGAAVYSRKHRISRIAFLTGPALVTCLAFLWMELGAGDRDAVRLLSIGIGASYGAIFTVLPSIVSSIWGVAHFGRNFGFITYAPFIGTPLFSYMYAFISAANSPNNGMCEGTSCWRATFWVSCGTSSIALCSTVVLWRQWRGYV